jgi:hypothetical protein
VRATSSRPETICELFARSPELALERAFKEHEQRAPYSGVGVAHLFNHLQGLQEFFTGYGSFKFISKRELQGRVYRIGLSDYYPSIHWLDVLHNSQTYKRVPAVGHVIPNGSDHQVTRPSWSYGPLSNLVRVNR